MGAAAANAGGFALQGLHSLEDESAAGALVKMARLNRFPREREIMGAGFAGQAEIGAGLAPLFAVWIDPASSGAFVGEQMS